MADQPKTPDFIYDPDNWDETYAWGDRDYLYDGMDPGEVLSVQTLTKGPPMWCALVPILWTPEGDPEDWEPRWFDTEAEAKVAANRSTDHPPTTGS